MPEPTAQSLARKARFWLILVVSVILFVGAVAVGTDCAVFHDRIHTGISISGVDVGGMTREEATAVLQALVDKARGSPITLTSGNTSMDVLPDDLGTTIEVERAVGTAMALTRWDDFLVDVVARFKLYFHGKDIAFQGDVDERQTQAFLVRLGQAFDRDPVDSVLVVQNDSVEATEAQNGRTVDESVLLQQLEALLFTLHSTTLEVPTTVTPPAVRSADNQAALEKAQTMLANPIVVSGGDQAWTLTTKRLAGWLEFRVVEQAGVRTTVPFFSPAKMSTFLDAIAVHFRKAPENARIVNDGKKAWVVPGSDGYTLDRAATAQAINEAAARRTERVVAARLWMVQPSMTTARAEAMGVKDKLATYTTKYSCPANRRTNVKLTTKYATNVFLAPGEEYDFDKRVGPRTPQRGYKLAPGIVENKKMAMVYGGGICQVSTTMFNAVFFAGLEVTERWNHSLYITHYPLGRDATVSGGGKNLRFRNDTGHHIWITGTSDGVTTTITIYGTSGGRKVAYTTRGRGGSYVMVQRKVSRPDGTLQHDDRFASVW